MIYPHLLNEKGSPLRGYGPGMPGMPGGWYDDWEVVVPLASRGIKREPVTLYRLIENKVPEWTKSSSPPKDYGSNCLEVYKKEVMAFTVYCNSVSWDGKEDTMDKTGNGSASSPFRNVNYALQALGCYRSIAECPKCNFYIRLVVSGVVNYKIGNGFANSHIILDGAGATFEYLRGHWGGAGANGDMDSSGGNYGNMIAGFGYVYNCKINVKVKCESRTEFCVISAGMIYNCDVNVTQVEEVSRYIALPHSSAYSGDTYNCRCTVDGKHSLENKSPLFYFVVASTDNHYNLQATLNIGAFCSREYWHSTSVLYKCNVNSSAWGNFGGFNIMYGCALSHNRNLPNESLAYNESYIASGEYIYNSTAEMDIKAKRADIPRVDGNNMYNCTLKANVEVGSTPSQQALIYGNAYNVSIDYTINIKPFLQSNSDVLQEFRGGRLFGFSCSKYTVLVDCSTNFSGSVEWLPEYSEGYRGTFHTCGTSDRHQALAVINFNEGSNICSKTDAQINCENEGDCENSCDCSRYNE